MTPEEISKVEASLISATFLGRSYRAAPKLVALLNKAESNLEVEWEKTDRSVRFADWHGIRGVGGYRKGGGFHSWGLAVDLNYARNGYVVTRTLVRGKIVYGGESGGDFPGARKAFADACDRACLAMDGQPADLSARKNGESTGQVWDRWHRVSEAVKLYFIPFFGGTDDLDVGEADVRPGVAIPPQILTDYQAIRGPLVVGAPSKNPRTTRNPAKGLMDIPRAVLVALGEVGLRTGLGDFGAKSSGDVMHVDTASRIPSGG